MMYRLFFVCLFIVQASLPMDHHPGPAIATLMKLSFDEEHRYAICTLGMYQSMNFTSRPLIRLLISINLTDLYRSLILYTDLQKKHYCRIDAY